MSISNSNTSTLDQLYKQGVNTFNKSLSISAQEFVANVDALAPEFGRLIVEMEFGAMYNRPGLNVNTRELVIIASCAALGATGLGALKMHIPAALRHGVTKAEIVESLVQVSMAAGLPAALGALQAANEVFAELDAKAAGN
ncbi:hypothetical protein C4K04_6544 [Pseudomonas chlororaphis]|uniref:Carboxymuconolactone decarboxylase-like domain-containing protein n=1 Tax=Pseudomonas chlororaphis TaxID=587753 RepID=A0A3G7U0E0_9PSED|nr:carboxymuconolactone decarboxylase family protein [Pseudomonas chlororaphis]AZE52172.1 hypothetical protein C4K04_6544 [Pseudomonas chlororaphis]